MAEKSEHPIEDTIEPVESPPSTPEYSQKDVPLVVKLAHENNFHIDLGWRSWTVLFLASFTLMGQVFVISAAGQVIAFIVRDLGEPEVAGWIIQGPLLMQSILSPTVGRLSDILDRKYMASIPPLFAFVGAIISAKASNMSMLIGGGILIGITLPTASIIHAIGAEVLPLKYRAVANGLAFLAASLGSVASGLGAGALTNQSQDGWRGIFWIQAGFHGLTSLGFLLLYWPEAHPDYPNMSFKQLLWKCDPIGSFFFMSACALLLVGLNWAGGKFAWSDPHVAVTVAVGFFLLICFLLYEWKGRSDGLIDHIFFQCGPNFPIGVLGFTVEGWIWYSAVNSVTPQQILHLGFEDNAWRISIRHLAYNFTGLSMSMAITAWATKKKDLQRPLLFTFGLCFIGVICYATLQPGPSMNKAQYFYSVIVGMGQAGPLTLLVPLVQFTAPHAYLASASGLAYSGRAMGGAFGSAVLDAIINSHVNSHLHSAIGSAATQAGLPETSVEKLTKAMDTGKRNLVSAIPGINADIIHAATNASRKTYARAYNLAWWSILPFVVISIVSLCFLRDVKELMTEKVEATVEHLKKEDVEEKAR